MNITRQGDEREKVKRGLRIEGRREEGEFQREMRERERELQERIGGLKNARGRRVSTTGDEITI